MARKITVSALFAAFALFASAAIPVRWTVDTFRVKPLVYECYHGETLDIAAAMTAYGEPLDLHGKTARLYWQTNGMDDVWWTTNASVRVDGGFTNVLAATFSGAYDTGAPSVTGFVGVEGENYRAAFQLKYLASPGFSPSTISSPTRCIDWRTTRMVNIDAAPFATNEIVDQKVGTASNNVLVAANAYTDIAVQQAGGMTPEMTSNVAGRVASAFVKKSIETNYVAAATMPPWLTTSEGRAPGQIGTVVEYYYNRRNYQWGVDFASMAAHAKEAEAADKAYFLYTPGGYGPYPWSLEFDGNVFQDNGGRLVAHKRNPTSGAIESTKTNAWLSDVAPIASSVANLQTQYNNLAAHKQNIIQIPTASMMEASDRTYDDIVQYVGTTTSKYHFGYFYKMRTYSPRAWDIVTPVDLSGYVQTSRKINGKPLSADISLTSSDVGAKPFFNVGNGLTETLSDNLYAWRRYTQAAQYTEYFTKSATPAAGSRLYNAQGEVVGQDWFVVVSYNSANNTIEVSDYAYNLTYTRYANSDITSNPVLSAVETDPNVPAWAKQPNPPATYTDAQAGAVATNVVREANGGVWDSTLQVWWTPKMDGGKLTYQATTNVNIQAIN